MRPENLSVLAPFLPVRMRLPALLPLRRRILTVTLAFSLSVKRKRVPRTLAVVVVRARPTAKTLLVLRNRVMSGGCVSRVSAPVPVGPVPAGGVAPSPPAGGSPALAGGGGVGLGGVGLGGAGSSNGPTSRRALPSTL